MIAILGSLSLSLETPWEMWGVGSATLEQCLCCPRVPVLGKSLVGQRYLLENQRITTFEAQQLGIKEYSLIKT